MYNKQQILNSQKDFIVSQYSSTEITVSQLAKKVGVDTSTLTRYASEVLHIHKAVKNKWTSEKIDWLKENYSLPYSEMSKALDICQETIRLKINDLGLIRSTRYRPFKLDMTDKEFLKDLDNSKLTAPDIVLKYKEKYSIGESRIHQLRKERGIKLQVNTLGRESSSEARVRKILDSLELAYIKEKPIEKYHIDFYLGFKICLEVQGSYWHSRPERKLRDSIKKAYLEEKGYTVLQIWDSIKDEEIKDIIVTTLRKQGLPV